MVYERNTSQQIFIKESQSVPGKLVTRSSFDSKVWLQDRIVTETLKPMTKIHFYPALFHQNLLVLQFDTILFQGPCDEWSVKNKMN